MDQGAYVALLDWLRRQVHQHGRQHEPDELMKLATGKSTDPLMHQAYLKERFDSLECLMAFRASGPHPTMDGSIQPGKSIGPGTAAASSRSMGSGLTHRVADKPVTAPKRHTWWWIP